MLDAFNSSHQYSFSSNFISMTLLSIFDIIVIIFAAVIIIITLGHRWWGLLPSATIVGMTDGQNTYDSSTYISKSRPHQLSCWNHVSIVPKT